VEAYKRIDRYAPGTIFYAWLCAIARNLLLNECRRIRREARRLDRVVADELAARAGSEEDAGDALDDSRVRALRECVSLLPAHAQSMLRLRYDRDASIERIARQVDKSLSAVKVYLFAVRRKLRECVEWKTAVNRA
jgi:RNA polymerase sigma factor (sigma-70 family)